MTIEMRKTKMKTAYLVLTFLLIGLSSGIYAQRGMGPGNCKVNNQLNGQGSFCQNIPDLTDEQSSQIEKLRIAHLKSMQKYRLEMSKKSIELQELRLAENMDMQAVNKVIDEKGIISNKKQKAKVSHQNDVRNLLTEEQKVNFDQTNRGMGQGCCCQGGNGRGFGKKHGCGNGAGRAGLK